MNPVFAAALLLMLAACTAAPPAAAPPAAAPVCPAVPECLRRQTDIRTHADLVRALVAERAAFDQCKAARDTLAACLENP